MQGDYAICKLDPEMESPDWAACGEFYSISRSADELSIICLHEQIPPKVPHDPGWRLLKIAGPFDFDEIGVLASITTPLAAARISLLTVSTYDTDYVLIKDTNYSLALETLESAGHHIHNFDSQ